MNNLLSGFPTWAKELAVHTLYVLISMIIVFSAILIFLVIRRWHFQTKIRRNGQDFKAASEYIRDNRKKLNGLQRILLAHTGEVFGLKSAIRLMVFIAVMCLLGWLILCTNVFDNIFEKYYKVISIVEFIASFFCLIIFFFLFQDFKKFGRLYVLLFLAFAIASAYLGIEILNNH